MNDAGKLDSENSAPIAEDAETLAAIDEAIREVEVGRTIPIEEVRERLSQWIIASASPKER
jgi:predicted transcriptional regulator